MWRSPNVNDIAHKRDTVPGTTAIEAFVHLTGNMCWAKKAFSSSLAARGKIPATY